MLPMILPALFITAVLILPPRTAALVATLATALTALATLASELGNMSAVKLFA